MTKIYRVCILDPFEERCEAIIGVNLPGGRYGLTGFWTFSFECAKNLLDARRDEVALIANGLSYSKLIETTIFNVEVEKDFTKYKTGHDNRFDSKELFVRKIKDEQKVKIIF
ncbi:hypothetical protein LI012_15975 [Caldibacillus thermoamylovorans]|uniref:hypothetical protein n=1 Tax=Caldibacillus thermoamylovorans TaxID=35841 RepID=UPI001D090BD7|nr:hypothetical protein [Caldibacillus thermoamylovorans]MCB5936752.1 hypothetical protein [Bacillus sp. DFI.2.34]MCB7078286.1 hypothetical protein [Caldibacillus thermoamylovorans]